MARVFSKRCQQALKEGKIKVSVPRSVRMRIWKLFEDYDERWGEIAETGWSYWTSRLERLTERIKSEHGLEQLFAYSEKEEGSVVSTDLKGFVLRGNYPPYLLDAIELLYENLSEDKKLYFQKEFNQIMEESNLAWRMAEGKIFPVDSQYIEEEILRKSYQLLHEMKFLGALQEFEKARIDLANEDYEGVIQNANLAVESTIKYILGIKKAKPGELYKKIIESGLIPEYFEGFLRAFEENILRSVAIIRNEQPGAGHGRGDMLQTAPYSLAELAVNLAGVLINYLIKRYLEKQTPQNNDNNNTDEANLPF
ncbi:hypothetical protein AT15_00340 [Kosmotoga arenicorallina S304]|uniref:Uncharacterized protein n=1 Tax=Kosmotoga arenicorallina S304 TaxID=1453497 RepID=A0A176K0N6_9BACT|nr:abortive infection family protein [Kosmotoga arenicorallina]OAA30189.1 hypothetical protein AT15_00340 [Kosmotoga arenicorallina S304]